MKLFLNAFIKFTVGLLLVGCLIFISAGSLTFANGWLFIGLLFTPMLAVGAVLFIKATDLLEKRLAAKKKENTQKALPMASSTITTRPLP